MKRDLEKLGIERERIGAVLSVIPRLIHGRREEEMHPGLRKYLEDQIGLDGDQIEGLQEFANQFRDLEREEIALARKFHELREVVIKAKRTNLTDDEQRRLKELGITWEEGETLLKRVEREYPGKPFAEGGRLNRGR